MQATLFAWVVEQSAEAYLMINDRDEIHYMNRQARVYLGLPPEPDMSVLHTFLALAGQHYACVPADAWTQWPGQPCTPAPRYLVRAASATALAVWLQVEMVRLPAQSQASMLVHLRDVTVQKTLQHEVWKFQTAITHKLHTPLWGVLGCLDMLAMEKADVPPECMAMVDLAMTSARRLRDEIDDVLQCLNVPRRIEPGNGYCLAELPPLVRRLCTDLDIDAVTVAVPESVLQARLAFAPLTLELMLQEIFENAKKFHPAQAPAIAVRVISTDAGHIQLQCCDDGVTRASEQFVRAWEPYDQGAKRLTGEVDGMGLGLAMVAALVWEKGGSCRLCNRSDGPGVVVELTLPLLVA